MANKNIIGIIAEMEDPNTGAPAAFHVINSLNINYKYNSASVILDSYFSRKHYAQGKQAMGSQTVTLNAAPPQGQCAQDWAYRQVVAPISDGAVDGYGNPILPHAFTGAELAEA